MKHLAFLNTTYYGVWFVWVWVVNLLG
jgi:hypothetical protein